MLIWIIYFWLMAALIGISVIGRIYLFFTREIVTGYDLVESLISLTAVAGVYGFAYQTPLVVPMFWKVVWAFLMLTWIWSFFVPKNAELIEKFGLAKGSGVVTLIALIAVPALAGLFFYSFRLPALWNR